MIHKIDDFLIDRVFQRIADFFASRVSCYGIAGFLLTGFLIGEVANVLVSHNWETLVAAPVVWIVLYSSAVRLDRKPVGEAAPEWRMLLLNVIARIGGVVMAPIHATTVVVGSIEGRLNSASALLLAASLYFLACRKNPPKRREARMPSGLAWQARP